jgi:hypothetical protein
MSPRQFAMKAWAHLPFVLKDRQNYIRRLEQGAREYRDRLEATSLAVNLRGIFRLMFRKPATDQPPVPPPGLMFRVSGGKKSDVFLGSGRETRDDFAAALEAHGRSFADFQHVLAGC